VSGIHLALDLSFTHTEGRWANAGSWTGTEYPDPKMYQEIAQLAERGGIDMLFFGDGTGIPDTWESSFAAAVKWGISWPRQDMSPYIAAMAQVTEHIGFGLTYSSTFMHPFYTARLLNSLDHVTGGRMAFNVVGSSRLSDAANYGYEQLMPHGERYDRMEEFIDVCTKLWDSVEPGVVVANRETRQYGDPTKVHRVDHHGTHFDVRGPLNSLPSPQGRPVVVQAGSSPRGIAASASFADIIFGMGGHLPSQQKHRADLDAALQAQGRDPQTVGILWDIQVLLGATEEEAATRKQSMLDGWDLDAVGTFLSYNAGYDFSKLPEFFALSDLAEEIISTGATQNGLVQRMIVELGADARVSRKQFFDRGWEWTTGYDHMVTGTPASVADQLEENFEATGSRGGFMIGNPMSTPSSIAEVAELLAPELRRRGALAPRYPARTLRENLLS